MTKAGEPSTRDVRWMSLALQEGRKGLGLTRPNPAVGAVVVKGGKCIASGWHAVAGGPHAEIVALRAAGHRARGAELFVTLEPCSTHGRTPPCTGAILEAGISRVVVGATDPNPAHAGQGMRILSKAGVECVSGVCRAGAEDLIRGFGRWIVTRRPWVALKMAVTLDGRIADASGDSKWITGAPARERVQQLRRESDAVMVGAGTVRADNPSLLPRPAGGRTTLRVIVDGAGRSPTSARVFTDDEAGQTLVLTSEAAPVAWRARLERQGVRVRPAGKSPVLRPAALLRGLGEEEVTSVLCEGGGLLAASLLKAGCVDELWWFVAPRILGARAVASVGAGPWNIARHPGFAVSGVETLGDDLLIRARRRDA